MFYRFTNWVAFVMFSVNNGKYKIPLTNKNLPNILRSWMPTVMHAVTMVPSATLDFQLQGRGLINKCLLGVICILSPEPESYWIIFTGDQALTRYIKTSRIVGGL